MLKKIGLPLMALLGVLALAPHQAKAAVRFGVYMGAPAYTYPAYPAPTYYAAPPYVAVTPAYVYPRRDVDRHEDRVEHRREEFREHRWQGHDRDDGGFHGDRR
jgi:hypothetical protein